ncbi:DUF5908 family protein [Aquimarina longa]|uniref:DUF5908 family protein n=1 Tax=Aquimarina longa TaxID=1080221 RepID=UPI000784D58E|nr:DUF5908 family protein [Aquimarina longa]
MAIEIKELHIKLHIGTDQSSSTKESNNSSGCCDEIANKELIIDETIKEVLRILKEQKER